MSNDLNENEYRVGWYWHDDATAAEPQAAVLRKEDGHIFLTIPIPPSFDDGEVSRWFDGNAVLHADDPDRSRFKYEPPTELMFVDSRGVVALLECRSFGKSQMLGGAAEGRIRVGFAVFDARSTIYSLPHRVRTYIPGMSSWTGLTSVNTDRSGEGNSENRTVGIKLQTPDEVRLTDYLTLKPGWGMYPSVTKGEILVRDTPSVESFTGEGVDFWKHLKLQRHFTELVELAFWEPTGFQKLQCYRDDDSLHTSGKWLVVESGIPEKQEESHSGLPLFFFGQIGPDGFENWVRLRSHFGRAVGALMAGVSMRSAPVETRFIQSCVGLEGLGVQIERDSSCEPEPAKKRGRTIPRLKDRLQLVIDDLGFSFSDNWAERTANAYNDVKHYDRDKMQDPQDLYLLLLENQLIFRAWASIKIGVSEDYIRDHIDTTPAGQMLIGTPGITFPRSEKPVGE